ILNDTADRSSINCNSTLPTVYHHSPYTLTPRIMACSKTLVLFSLSMAILLMISPADVEGARALTATNNTSNQVKETNEIKDAKYQNDNGGNPGRLLPQPYTPRSYRPGPPYP
ncbi:hypothetical protein Leryth_007660, partial [Lithospermum erythrorhizon]